MPTTSNFGWTTPADTDLVKNGALAIRTLGNGIDTSMAELKGGTTGQVLSKASNTDMDFTWTTDASGISPTIVDAKGDLIAASAADTPARLAVGNNGETLVADSSATTGLRYQSNFAAGKNKIINGDFGIWQRGTSFSSPSSTAFTADRFAVVYNGTGATRTISQQTFTAGAAPVAGYESQFFLRWDNTVAGTSNTTSYVRQTIEDVRTFAGQSVTLSYWAKANASVAAYGAPGFRQFFGSGGSSEVITGFTGGTPTYTTDWQRFTFTVTVPSISGKTIGTNSYAIITIPMPVGTTFTVDIWGVQLEAGSVATAFQTATGTLAGELMAAQRYYFRASADTAYAPMNATGYLNATTNALMYVTLPVTMRVAPTSVDYSTLRIGDVADQYTAVTVVALDSVVNQKSMPAINCTTTGATQYRWCRLQANNSTSAYIGFSAEL